MVPLWQRLLGLAILVFLTTFWTWVTVLRMIFQFIKNPSGFFRVQSRPNAPKCLTEGWVHSYLSLTGRNVKLHYVQTGDSSKPLMLFVHGFPEFWYSWRNQLREFAKDYRAVAIDMRGYGDSSKPSGISNYTVPDLVEDVAAFVKELGYQKCVLVAHDWGGAVAWQVALQHPEIVSKLIIMNCPHPVAFRKVLYGKWRQLLKSWYMFFFQCPVLPELFMRTNDFDAFEQFFRTGEGSCRNKNAFSDEDMEAWKYTFGQRGALTPPINYYRASFQRTQPVRPAGVSNMVQPPTLIIWGTADLALDQSMASLSCNYCENATLKLVEGASHWVQQDEPALCNTYMRDFLNH